MSGDLDIAASLARRRTDGGAGEPARTDEAGEAAWDLPAHAEPDSEPAAEHVDAANPPAPRARQQGAFDANEVDDEIEDTDTGVEPPAFPAFPGFGDEEESPAGPGIDIMRFVRGVWKRKWIVIALAAIITLLFLLLALSLPREWQGTTTLIMQTHQDQVQIGAATPFKPQNYDLDTFIDTIKLPSSLDETMQRVGIDVMRRTLAGAISVRTGKESEMFAISVVWDTPQMAARIANTVAELFIEQSTEIRRRDAQESFDYYNAQLREARAELERVNAERVAFEQTHRIASLEDQIQVLVGQVASTQATYDSGVAELGAMRAALKRVTAQLEDEPEMIVTSSRYRSPFKQRLSEYQWELKEARTRYTDENPKIQRLMKRIATLEQLIAESNDEVAPENVYRLNPQRAELSLRQQELTDQIQVLEAQTAAQRKTLDESRSNLEELSIARAGYSELQARIADLERLESKLAARVAEVRVAMLRNESGFGILERATPADLPMPSMRKLVAAAGVILGGGFGLFVALVLELLDPLVRTARDAGGITGCELLLEFQQAPHGDDALIEHEVPTSPVSVLFRRIVNELGTGLKPDQWRSLAVTSAEPGSGRSLTAMNLASALGLKDQLTLVVDADVRADAGARPSQVIGLEALHPSATITDVLSGAAEPQEAYEPTMNPAVRVLTAGDYQNDNGLLLLGSKGFKQLARRFAREREHVIYDLPPLQAMESVVEAAAEIGNVLLVVRSGHTRRADLKDVTATLAAREVEIRAVLITDVPRPLLAGKPAFGAAPPPEKGKRKRPKKPKRRPADPIIIDEDLSIG